MFMYDEVTCFWERCHERGGSRVARFRSDSDPEEPRAEPRGSGPGPGFARGQNLGEAGKEAQGSSR